MGKGYSFTSTTRQGVARKMATFRGIVHQTFARNSTAMGITQSHRARLYIGVVDVCGAESYHITSVWEKIEKKS